MTEIRTRHLYVAVAQQYWLPALVTGSADQVREAFRVLLAPDGLDRLLFGNRVASGVHPIDDFGWDPFGEDLDLPDLEAIPTAPAPYVPYVGSVTYRRGAQLDHRALRHEHGDLLWPPRSVRATGTGFPAADAVDMEDDLRFGYSELKDTFVDTSHHRLYEQRRVIEGSASRFCGSDQSGWHIALSLDPRRRIRDVASPNGATASRTGPGFRLAPRTYAHIYPYGAVTCWFGCSVTAGSPLPLAEFARVLRPLLGHRTPAASQFRFASKHHPALPLGQYLDRLADRIASAIHIVPVAATKMPGSLRAVRMSATVDMDSVDRRQIAGLLVLEPNWQSLGQRVVDQYSSLYGLYDTDWVSATAGSMVANASPAVFKSSSRRNLFWRLALTMELARIQRFAFPMLASLARDEDRDVSLRALLISEHLLDFHRGLPAHHRKWYYRCSDVLGVDEQARMLRDALSEGKTVTKYEFNLSGNATVGVINTGRVAGNITSNLNALAAGGNIDIADALKSLTEATIGEEGIDPQTRSDALENLELLSEEAAAPPEERRLALVRNAVNYLGQALSTVVTLAEAWGQFGPVISAFFGLG